MAIDIPLTALFGTNASQDETTITITKADLPLTPATVNQAQQILVALIKKWNTNQDSSPDSIVAVRPQPHSLAIRGGSKKLYRYMVDCYSDYAGPSEPDADDFVI